MSHAYKVSDLKPEIQETLRELSHFECSIERNNTILGRSHTIFCKWLYSYQDYARLYSKAALEEVIKVLGAGFTPKEAAEYIYLERR